MTKDILVRSLLPLNYISSLPVGIFGMGTGRESDLRVGALEGDVEPCEECMHV